MVLAKTKRLGEGGEGEGAANTNRSDDLRQFPRKTGIACPFVPRRWTRTVSAADSHHATTKAIFWSIVPSV